MEDELQLLAADRDFAARTADKLTVELDALRAAHEELKLRYDRACRSPIEADGLSERMLRMVELAHVEANEIVQNARTKAERTRTAADEEARRLRGRYERKLHELEQRRAAMEAEHAELMRTSRAEFEEKERQAEERRRRLDEESARRRQQAERDLALVLKARREEATKAIEQREAESKERAATLVAEAESRAADMIAQATERVRELEEVQRQLTGRLREARDVLAAAMPLTAPLPEETAEPALAHARPGSGEDEPVADDVRADSAREVRPGVPPAGCGRLGPGSWRYRSSAPTRWSLRRFRPWVRGRVTRPCPARPCRPAVRRRPRARRPRCPGRCRPGARTGTGSRRWIRR
ncbi:metallopeptidase [Prauserella oleivorans]